MPDDLDLDSRLAFLRTRRDAAAMQLRHADLEIGQTIGELLDCESAHSLSSIARMLGISHTHVKTLARRAQAASDTVDGRTDRRGWLPPMLSGFHAAKYLASTGRRVHRVIASFSSADILWISGLPPSMFDHGPGMLDLPHMLWQLDDGSWLSVGPVNVGYGGTGGTLAFQALDRAGVNEDMANEIANLRWSDTHIERGETVGATTWPKVRLAAPASLGSFYVLAVGRDSLTQREERIDPTGFYPSHPAGSPFTWAIDYLDGVGPDHAQPLPTWLHGPRRARVFLDTRSAHEQGFGDRERGCTLVIEQGDLQLWVFTYPPRDPTQLLSDEAYDALAYAGLYPDELAKLDARGRFWRYIDQRFGPQRPPYLDISHDDQGPRHAPGADAAPGTVPLALLAAP